MATGDHAVLGQRRVFPAASADTSFVQGPPFSLACRVVATQKAPAIVSSDNFTRAHEKHGFGESEPHTVTACKIHGSWPGFLLELNPQEGFTGSRARSEYSVYP